MCKPCWCVFPCSSRVLAILQYTACIVLLALASHRGVPGAPTCTVYRHSQHAGPRLYRSWLVNVFFAPSHLRSVSHPVSGWFVVLPHQQTSLWTSFLHTDHKRGTMHCLRIHVTLRSALDELAIKVVPAVKDTLWLSMADFVLVRSDGYR